MAVECELESGLVLVVSKPGTAAPVQSIRPGGCAKEKSVAAGLSAAAENSCSGILRYYAPDFKWHNHRRPCRTFNLWFSLRLDRTAYRRRRNEIGLRHQLRCDE